MEDKQYNSKPISERLSELKLAQMAQLKYNTKVYLPNLETISDGDAVGANGDAVGATLDRLKEQLDYACDELPSIKTINDSTNTYLIADSCTYATWNPITQEQPQQFNVIHNNKVKLFY